MRPSISSARGPLSAAAALQLGLGPFLPLPLSDASLAARLADMPDPPLALTYDEALQLCEHISTRVGAAVTLPTADELECAARGTDGRRFPWGNGLEKVDARVRSPHGIVRRSTRAARVGRPALAALRWAGAVAGGECGEAGGEAVWWLSG